MHFVQQILQSLALAKKKKKEKFKKENKKVFHISFRVTTWRKYYPIYYENYCAEYSVLTMEEY